jgi:cyclic-di-GMP-binding protein
MSLSIKLPHVDDNPILLAETRAYKINEFIQNLPFGDPIAAANDLVEELQILNSQKVAFANRLTALELYRPAAFQIYQDLLPHFSKASLPTSSNALSYADAATRLWQQISYGYKFALVELQGKILQLNNTKASAQVIQRAIHANKEIALISYLTYKAPSFALWAELHQLYYVGLQHNVEKLPVEETITANNVSTINTVYAQILLLALADPQHLANQDILRVDNYLSVVAKHAEFRPLGMVDSPLGVFLVALDGDKPPTPFLKNRDIPDGNTDMLLLTISLARVIHLHMKLLADGMLPNDGSLPESALTHHATDLLAYLMKHFGRTPQRVFSRTKKSDGVELSIGIGSTHQLIRDNSNTFTEPTNKNGAFKPSRWQILNVSAGGYALRKFNTSQADAQVGDIVAMKDNSGNHWELAVLRWANINEQNQLDVGLQLISPSATAVIAKSSESALESEALLLPELAPLKQAASIITTRGLFKTGDTIELNQNNELKRVQTTKLVERTAGFERYEYNLI